MFKKLLFSSYQEVEALMIKSGVNERPLVNDFSKFPSGGYLLESQSMYIVLGLKQQEILKNSPGEWVNSAHYYGYWSVNGVYGPTKFMKESGNLLDIEFKAMLNSMQTLYSQQFADGVLGKPMIPFYKMVGVENRQLMDFLEECSLRNEMVSDELHPHSPLRTIMDEFGIKIKK